MRSKQDELPLFPVSEWEIGHVPAHEIIFLRLAFLSHSMQPLTESDPRRRYALTSVQLRELIPALERALHKLESAGTQGAPPDSSVQ